MLRSFAGASRPQDFVLPGFYAHAARAYALLRPAGVGCGKRGYLDAGRVERFHHAFEFANGLPRCGGGRIAGCGGEVAQGVVSPVIGQAAIQQMPVLHEMMHRHELDGRDAQFMQVLNRRR